MIISVGCIEALMLIQDSLEANDPIDHQRNAIIKKTLFRQRPKMVVLKQPAVLHFPNGISPYLSSGPDPTLRDFPRTSTLTLRLCTGPAGTG